MNTLHHSIIGLPGSGKTTYLAALWHLITAEEVETKLCVDRLDGDHEHLENIAEAWRRCEPVPRTSMADEKKVSIHIRVCETSNVFVLDFPDLSGESFEEQFSTRKCRSSYVDDYSKQGGVLLFINADRPQDGMTVLDLMPVLEDVEHSGSASGEQDWSPKHVPEQVRLVDLLQFLLRPPFIRRPRRLAVIVSAWDVVDQPKPIPKNWLAREMPFLHQFLNNNQDSFDFRVFGVSAQGGSLTSEVTRLHLAKQTPSKRIQCIEPSIDQHDLTAPLMWLCAIG